MATLAMADDPAGYLQVTGPCRLEFPRDHGAHPGYRTEWWYYTGNVEADSGQLFGYQLTLFRRQIVPPFDAGAFERPVSAWRTGQVYFGHAAISDITAGRHWQAEGIARGALEMAGTRQQPDRTAIWLHNWSIQIEPGVHHLSARTPEFSIFLRNIPAKPPVLHGDDGYSRKGSGADRASCYYSFTRMAAEGDLSIGGRSFSVEGQSWMDHEFSTAPLEPGIVGWDWFSLQLSDNSEIMLFLLRTASGDLHPASSGTYVDRSGASVHLEQKHAEVTVVDRWKSAKSGAVYPSRWRLQIEHLGIDLVIASRLADQEMDTNQSTGVTYWEGSVSIEGRSSEGRVKGDGYVELTGYARPFEAPM